MLLADIIIVFVCSSSPRDPASCSNSHRWISVGGALVQPRQPPHAIAILPPGSPTQRGPSCWWRRWVQVAAGGNGYQVTDSGDGGRVADGGNGRQVAGALESAMEGTNRRSHQRRERFLHCSRGIALATTHPATRRFSSPPRFWVRSV